MGEFQPGLYMGNVNKHAVTFVLMRRASFAVRHLEMDVSFQNVTYALVFVILTRYIMYKVVQKLLRKPKVDQAVAKIEKKLLKTPKVA